MARKAWASKVYFEVTNHCNFRCDFCVLEVIAVLNLFLDGMTIPTNLIAGSSRYSFRRFVAWDAVGMLVWILLHAGLGYAFASQWQLVSETISSHGGWLGLCAAVGTGIYLLLRRRRANQGRVRW
jgi:membrane protein DedA with SNARE-associated domain